MTSYRNSQDLALSPLGTAWSQLLEAGRALVESCFYPCSHDKGMAELSPTDLDFGIQAWVTLPLGPGPSLPGCPTPNPQALCTSLAWLRPSLTY